ncbi:MAG: 4Fe-4S dicluster domain-containing protein [Nitrospirae bacterium]|nr:MAG: 4Fe-4S dicluster domain-containing protein [Nitrospirota bacterium]
MKYLSNVATLMLDREKCTGCGNCTEVCPHAVLSVRDKKASITDLDKCMECGACETNCPFGAITVDRGVGCAAALINSMLYGGEPSCDCSSSQSGKTTACC